MQGINGCDTRILWSGSISKYNTDLEQIAREREEWEGKVGPSEDKTFLIKCQECNKPFWSNSGNAKFCSEECRHTIAADRAREAVAKHKYCKDKRALYARLEKRFDDQLAVETERDEKVYEKCYTLNELNTCDHYYTGQHGLKCYFCKRGIDYPSMVKLTATNECCCCNKPIAESGKVYLYDTVDKSRHRQRFAVIPGVGKVLVDKNLKNLYHLDNKFYIVKGEEKTEWKLPQQ